MTKSYIAKSSEVTQKYYVIDAQDKVLGRLATKAATILRGKHKRTYTPHVDTGDFVVVINAEKIRVTGKKLEDKMYIKYTGFHSGLKSIALKDLLAKRPVKVIELAVHRMIPNTSLGNKMRRKLKVYAGSEHPYAAQKPIALEI
jgi:large subunit ribosomal protein L13